MVPTPASRSLALGEGGVEEEEAEEEEERRILCRRPEELFAGQ